MNKVTGKYFSILNDYFGEMFKIASKEEFDAKRYSKTIGEIYDLELAVSIMDSMHEELVQLDWDSQVTELQRIGGLKSLYMGKGISYLQPVSATSDFLKKTALYTDTIILKDDVLTGLSSWKDRHLDTRLTFGWIMQNAIEFLYMENLFSSDLNQPICALAPSFYWYAGKNNLEARINECAMKSTEDYASEIFGKDFKSVENLRKFLSEIKDWPSFLSLARKPQLLVNPDGTPVTKENFENLQFIKSSRFGPDTPPYLDYELLLRSPFSSITMDLLYTGGLKSILATNFRGHWDQLTWLTKHDNEMISDISRRKMFSKDELVVSALQQEDLKWLGNVPINKIEELRERGELQDLRALLSENIQEIEDVTDDDFLEVSRQVKYNIEQIMKKHDTDVKDLNEKYRLRYGIGVSSIAVTGTLGFVTAVFPPIALATGITAGIVGGGSIIETIKDYVEKREAITDLKKKPVALLFDAKKMADPASQGS